LSIVKKLCALLAVDIHISSQKDIGTSVILSLQEEDLK
jgi:hypothetical protein